MARRQREEDRAQPKGNDGQSPRQHQREAHKQGEEATVQQQRVGDAQRKRGSARGAVQADMAADKAFEGGDSCPAKQAAEQAVQAAREAEDSTEAEGVSAPGAQSPQREQCS